MHGTCSNHPRMLDLLFQEKGFTLRRNQNILCATSTGGNLLKLHRTLLALHLRPGHIDGPRDSCNEEAYNTPSILLKSTYTVTALAVVYYY